MGNGPAFEDFDLEIKNEEELKEAKEAAGVKSEKKMLEDVADYAIEINDEELFNKVTELHKKILEANGKNLEDYFKDIVEEYFPNKNEADKSRLSNRLKVICNGLIEAKQDDDYEDIIEEGVKRLLTEEWCSIEYTRTYKINKDGTVSVEKVANE